MDGPPTRSQSLLFDLVLLTVFPSTGLGAGCILRSLEFDLLLFTVVASTGLGIGCVWRSLEFDFKDFFEFHKKDMKREPAPGDVTVF